MRYMLALNHIKSNPVVEVENEEEARKRMDILVRFFRGNALSDDPKLTRIDISGVWRFSDEPGEADWILKHEYTTPLRENPTTLEAE